MPNQSRVSERRWGEAVLWAAVIVALATAASALINPLIGRTVHWNIVAVLMPALFVLFAVLLKKRWV